jgi:hypothetical protein
MGPAVKKVIGREVEHWRKRKKIGGKKMAGKTFGGKKIWRESYSSSNTERGADLWTDFEVQLVFADSRDAKSRRFEFFFFFFFF